jgi:hypothetical protein
VLFKAEKAAKRAKSAVRKECRGAAKVHRFFLRGWLKIAKIGETK